LPWGFLFVFIFVVGDYPEPLDPGSFNSLPPGRVQPSEHGHEISVVYSIRVHFGTLNRCYGDFGNNVEEENKSDAANEWPC